MSADALPGVARAVDYDPYAPATQVDPYPAYRALREHAPVHYVEKRDLWILSRWEDVQQAAPDPTFSAALGVAMRDPLPANGEGLPPYAHSVVTSDPPEHTRMRRMLQKVFGARAIRTWPTRIQVVADSLVAEVVEAAKDGAGDLAGQLARPLPTAVVCELMTLPREDMSMITTWSDDALAILPGAEAAGTEVAMRAGQASVEMAAYIRQLVIERRKRPLEGDLISDVVAVRNGDGSAMSEDNLVGNLITIMMAGLETTSGLISSGAAALLSHPSEYHKLRRDPDLLEPAVEEMLRYDPPSQAGFRTVTQDVKVRGQVIPSGSRVALTFAAANRDEDRFPDGDGEGFKIDRASTGHVSFGIGMHFCLGALLARFEGRAAFRSLFEQTTTIELSGPPVVNTTIMPVLRGHSSVPITAT